ncbi:hypothetical protein GOV10_04580, partial [Candidatus Woesearchaeota archaeon]|nr:hypothetical protein [Candidatus Woesearchaeota archaeon]
EDWLEKKLRYAFIIAFVYSAVAILGARLLFAANSGLVSVVFTSLLLIPYLQKLFEKEEMAELREKSGFKVRTFIKDNLPAIKVYAALFLGIYIAFMLYSFFLPIMGFDTGVVFREQLSLESGFRGNAFSIDTFLNIFLNNWWVLLACFLLALLTGDGAIFFITWNASTWGAIFGYRALAAAFAGGFGNPYMNLLLIFAITLPHVILEGGAYVLAAISGSIISDDVISESGEVPHFLAYLLGVLLAYGLLVFIFATLFPSLLVLRGFLNVFVLFGLLWLLGNAFDDADHKRVYWYNYRLFIIAVLLFLVGAFVETVVLSNSSLLATIYSAALS